MQDKFSILVSEGDFIGKTIMHGFLVKLPRSSQKTCQASIGTTSHSTLSSYFPMDNFTFT